MLNPLFDSAVLFFFGLTCIPPECSEEDLNRLEFYRAGFARQIEPVISSPSQNGYFFDSCFIHCQTIEDDVAWSQIRVGGRSIVQAFGDWYFERSGRTRLRDCDADLPCNPTCPEFDGGAVRNSASPYLLTLALQMAAVFAWQRL